METIEDRDEEVRISCEESKRGDKERVTIERTSRVRKTIEEPKGRMRRGDMMRIARSVVGGRRSESQESPFMLPDSQPLAEDEEEEEKEEGHATPKRKHQTAAHHHVSIQEQSTRGHSKSTAKAKAKAAPKPSKRKPAPTTKRRPGPGAHKDRPRRRRHVARMGAAAEVTESFGRYIHRVLQQVHPDLTVSKKSLEVVDSMVVDMYVRIVSECRRLLALTGKKTLTSREVQSAVRLVLPGELASHAVSEGTKAVVMVG